MKRVLIIILSVIVLLIAGYIANRKYTKSFSPERKTEIAMDGLKVQVKYCQPSKKGRLIFGYASDTALVPYGELWRTGANEATEIQFNIPVIIQNDTIPAGRYALFTIPGEEDWSIILNTKLGQWGAFTYNPGDDLARFSVRSGSTPESIEDFTITLTEGEKKVHLSLLWDQTVVTLPISKLDTP